MRLLVCFLLPLAAWCAPAALLIDGTISEDSLKPLIRTKRADEEILYGNHQNNAQFVKKADPSLPLDNEEAVIDKKATITISKQKINRDDVKDNLNDVMWDAGNKVAEDKTEDEEVVGPDQDGNIPIMGKYQPEPEWKDQATEGSGEVDWGNQDNYLENYNYYEDIYPFNDVYRRRRSTKEKRSAPKQLLTAESMDSSPGNARVKRDLTADDIYDWLEYGGKTDDYYPEYDVEDVEDPSEAMKDLAMAQLLEDYLEPEQAVDEVDYPAFEDNSVDDASNTKDLLSLLEYLVENEPAEESESPAGSLYPEDIQEEWEDLDPQDIDTAPESLSYEPIVYEGVPGIFIPLEQQQPAVSKRQFLSMVPGVKKRNSFYPYDEEPEGHWGAFVPTQEEKRNAEAYDRLYRMAEALNAPDKRYFNSQDYKKK